MSNLNLDLLFGAYRQKTLSLLLLHPEESLFVREISRRTGVPAGALHKELRTLADMGLLTRKPVGNQIHYQANRSSPIYVDLASIFRKTTGLVDVLRTALEQVAPVPILAAVFGSMASGTAVSTSDVDVLVIGKNKFDAIVTALRPCEQVIAREINPIVYSEREFQKRAKDNDPFVTNIVTNPKLFIIGTDHDLEKLAGNKTTSKV